MISVIIPSKTSSNLLPCYAAVRQHQPDAQIIVVDDGCEAIPDGVEVVQGVKPFIYARNCNLGIIKALNTGATGVVLLNDDALLESPDGFGLLARCCDADPKIAFIGCTTNVTGQRLQWRMGKGLREVPDIAFVGVYIPKRTVAKLGVLDERYCIDYGVEDRDYCEAAKRKGLKICVHDDCYLDHGSLVSSFRGDPKTPRSYMGNFALFKQKWGIK